MLKNVSVIAFMVSIRLFLAALFLYLIDLFVQPMRIGIINIGNVGGTVTCGILLVITVFFGSFMKLLRLLWKSSGGRVFLIITAVMTVLFIIYASVISIFMYRASKDKPRDGNTTLVILGCKVRNGFPSEMLRLRLDAAYDFLIENPDTPVVVSGGQGSDEIISEAQCMKEYLVKRGISEDRIYMEDKSASTEENLKFSKELIEKEGLCRDITIVTDGYHQLRAEMLARRTGMEASNISSDTQDWLLPTYWVREWFGIIYSCVLRR